MSKTKNTYIMLDYNKLSEQVEAILSKFDNEKINNWLNFDQKRIENENFTNGRKVNILVEKTTKPKFNDISNTFKDNDDDNFSLAA